MHSAGLVLESFCSSGADCSSSLLPPLQGWRASPATLTACSYLPFPRSTLFLPPGFQRKGACSASLGGRVVGFPPLCEAGAFLAEWFKGALFGNRAEEKQRRSRGGSRRKAEGEAEERQRRSRRDAVEMHVVGPRRVRDPFISAQPFGVFAQGKGSE